MSKNFETEYKKYADSAVPDLWSRIEAGVDAYEESIRKDSEVTAEKETGKIVNIDSYNRNNKEKKKINYKPYLGAIAACACMFLVVIAIKSIDSSKSATASAESAAPAAAPMMEEAASDSADDNVAYAQSEEAVAEVDEAPAADETLTNGITADASAYEADEAEEEAYYDEEAAPAEAEASEEDSYTYDIQEAPSLDIENSKTTFAAPQKKEKRHTGNVNEITVLASVVEIEKVKSDSDREISLKITDPLETGLKKDEVISASMDKEFDKAGEDAGISTLRGGTDTIIKAVLRVEKDGKYTLVRIEEQE